MLGAEISVRLSFHPLVVSVYSHPFSAIIYNEEYLNTTNCFTVSSETLSYTWLLLGCLTKLVSLLL
jgi:hypothetical protein